MSSSVGISDSTHDSLAAVTCRRHIGQFRLCPLLRKQKGACDDHQSLFRWQKNLLDYSSLWAIISPFINAFLTEAVCTGQNEVRLSVHADTTLLLVSQLLHSAPTHKQRTDKVLLLFLRKKSTDLKEGGKKRKIVFWLKCLISEESWSLVIKRSAWEKYHSVI